MGDADSWVTEFKVVISDDGRKWFPLITDDGDNVVNIYIIRLIYSRFSILNALIFNIN